MGPDENKAVVQRFYTEVMDGGHLEVIDELFAPTFVNRELGHDLASWKTAMGAAVAAFPEHHWSVQGLIAEGEEVVARVSFELRDQAGETISGHGLTWFRLADGKIVEDDPIMTPDIMQAVRSLAGSFNWASSS